MVVKFGQLNLDPTVRAYYDLGSILFWNDQAEVRGRGAAIEGGRETEGDRDKR